MPPATYIAAMLTSTLIVFAIQTLALFLIGRIFYGAPFPSAIGSLVLAVIIGAGVFAAVGGRHRVAHPLCEGSSAVVNFICCRWRSSRAHSGRHAAIRGSCARSATCCR